GSAGALPSVGGYGGPFRGPGDANAKSRSGPAPPGRFRALGVWGAISWPRGRQRQIEERPGSARALPSVGGYGGHGGAPRGPGAARGKSRSGPAPSGRFGALGGLAGLGGARADLAGQGRPTPRRVSARS